MNCSFKCTIFNTFLSLEIMNIKVPAFFISASLAWMESNHFQSFLQMFSVMCLGWTVGLVGDWSELKHSLISTPMEKVLFSAFFIRLYFLYMLLK